MGNFYFESMTRFAKGYFNKLYLEKKKGVLKVVSKQIRETKSTNK